MKRSPALSTPAAERTVASAYRLFHLGAGGDAVDVEEFSAISDELAISHAASRTGSHRGELWCWTDHRFVALITRGDREAARSRS